MAERDLVEIFERNRSRRRFEDFEDVETAEDERPWERERECNRILERGREEAEKREWVGRRTGPPRRRSR